jgi:Putative transposase
MIGALPALPQLLIGADLQKSRLLALRLGSLFQTALCRSAIWAVTRIESRSPTTDWLLSKRGQVIFRWRDSLHNKKRLMRLPVEGFLCRFLLHVLPKAWYTFVTSVSSLPGAAPPYCRSASNCSPRSPTTRSRPFRRPPHPALHLRMWRLACGGPMLLVERLTPTEARFRSPPTHPRIEQPRPVLSHLEPTTPAPTSPKVCSQDSGTAACEILANLAPRVELTPRVRETYFLLFNVSADIQNPCSAPQASFKSLYQKRSVSTFRLRRIAYRRNVSDTTLGHIVISSEGLHFGLRGPIGIAHLHVSRQLDGETALLTYCVIRPSAEIPAGDL